MTSQHSFRRSIASIPHTRDAIQTSCVQHGGGRGPLQFWHTFLSWNNKITSHTFLKCNQIMSRTIIQQYVRVAHSCELWPKLLQTVSPLYIFVPVFFHHVVLLHTQKHLSWVHILTLLSKSKSKWLMFKTGKHSCSLKLSWSWRQAVVIETGICKGISWCERTACINVITPPMTIFRGFISIFGGWMLLCKELVTDGDFLVRKIYVAFVVLLVLMRCDTAQAKRNYIWICNASQKTTMKFHYSWKDISCLPWMCVPVTKSIMHKTMSQIQDPVTNYNHAKFSLAFNNHNKKEIVSSFWSHGCVMVTSEVNTAQSGKELTQMVSAKCPY